MYKLFYIIALIRHSHFDSLNEKFNGRNILEKRVFRNTLPYLHYYCVMKTSIPISACVTWYMTFGTMFHYLFHVISIHFLNDKFSQVFSISFFLFSTNDFDILNTSSNSKLFFLVKWSNLHFETDYWVNIESHVFMNLSCVSWFKTP